MAVAKQQEFDRHRAIHENAGDRGTQAVRDWLYAERDRLNAAWVSEPHEQNLRVLQGAARTISRLIAMIEIPPRIKETEDA